MPKIAKTIHFGFRVNSGPLEKYAPEVQFAPPDGADPAEKPRALIFFDEVGNVDVYVIDEEAKKAIIAALSSGIVVPGAKPAAPPVNPSNPGQRRRHP